jgi:putative Mg2+ transporter-C (MgtC) family protein
MSLRVIEMSPSLGLPEVVLRLTLTVGIGIAIGYNRSQHGKAAGMRTTVLVCLAASVAMIQVNLLLPTAGRAPDSFVMNDLMRLPLGILTGVGFIGGGAILRRDNIVVGVTTAATLWLVTVIGLCVGGGQLILALAATAIGLFALWILQWVEDQLQQERSGRLTLELESNGPKEPEIRRRLGSAGLLITGSQKLIEPVSGRRRLVLEMRQVCRRAHTETPPIVDELASAPGVVSVQWQGHA